MPYRPDVVHHNALTSFCSFRGVQDVSEPLFSASPYTHPFAAAVDDEYPEYALLATVERAPSRTWGQLPRLCKTLFFPRI